MFNSPRTPHSPRHARQAPVSTLNMIFRLLVSVTVLFFSFAYISSELTHLILADVTKPHTNSQPVSSSILNDKAHLAASTLWNHEWKVQNPITTARDLANDIKGVHLDYLIPGRLEVGDVDHAPRQLDSQPIPDTASPQQPDPVPPAANKPPMTIVEVTDFFGAFLKTLNKTFKEHKNEDARGIWEAYYEAAERDLYPWDQEYLLRMPKRRDDNSIFLSVASYRDENCLNTLTEAYSQAERPEFLYIGLVQQNCNEKCRTGVLDGGKIEDTEPDEDCAKLFCESAVGAPHCKAGRVRTLLVEETESLGPYAARFFGSKLWHGEPWYMQIDSHMTFMKNWDTLSVSMLQAAPSEKPILTHYPPAHTSKLGGVGSRICQPIYADSEIEDQIIRLMGSENFERKIGPIPRFAPFVAAGYFVSHSEFLSDVPFDPFLPWIFMGEEISMSARLYTAGYDMFSPTTSVLGHIYVRRHKPKFWETFARVFRHGMHNAVQMLVLRRVKHTMGYPEDTADLLKPNSLLAHIDEYGMGHARPLREYLEMVGLDMVSKTVTKQDWCYTGKPPPLFADKYGHLYG